MYEDTIEVGQDKNIWEIHVWSDIPRLTFVIVDDVVWMLVSPNMNKCASLSTCLLTLDIVFLIRTILSVWSGLTVILIYISIVTNEGEQLFICMLTFNITSLVKSLFKLCPFFFLSYLFFDHAKRHAGSRFPEQGLNLHFPHWKCRVVTTGRLRKS